MIYGNNGNPTRLYGEVADNFLESVGVSIFDDGDIAIGESIVDLSTGCDILEENGITLCEDYILVEGEYGNTAKKFGDRVITNMKKAGRKMLTHGDDDAVKARNKEKLKNAHDRKMSNFDKVDERNRLLYAKHDPEKYERMSKINAQRRAAATKAFEKADKRIDKVHDMVRRMESRVNSSKNESTIFSDIEII